MAITITLYDHTVARFSQGLNLAAHTYRVKLLTAATFDATDTTLADTGGTEVTNAYGYTTGGIALGGVSIATVTTNDARFDADDLTINATGGSIAAQYGILYNDTDLNNAPVAFINLDGTKTAPDGTQFRLAWHADGIVKWTYTP